MTTTVDERDRKALRFARMLGDVAVVGTTPAGERKAVLHCGNGAFPSDERIAELGIDDPTVYRWEPASKRWRKPYRPEVKR